MCGTTVSCHISKKHWAVTEKIGLQQLRQKSGEHGPLQTFPPALYRPRERKCKDQLFWHKVNSSSLSQQEGQGPNCLQSSLTIIMICLIVEILGKEERKDVEIKLVSLIRNQEVQKFIKLQKTFKDLQKNFPKLI